jgi:hypothetical protein
MTRTITVLALSLLAACCAPTPAATDPTALEACSPDAWGAAALVRDGGIGWTATYPATFGETADLFVGELDASGARRDFRITAFAGYDAEVAVAVTCSSGLARCYGVGPTYTEELGGASIEGSTCLVSETAMAWAVVGCEDPAAAVTIEVSVERREGREACAYDLAVSVIPES